MSTNIQREPLTQLLLTTLSATGKPVGDGRAPQNAGWSGNMPNKDGSNFTPYSVLTPGPASQSMGPMSDAQADWHLDYSISSFGVSRQQCEWMSDKARLTLAVLAKTQVTLGTSTYRVQQVRVDALGGIQRIDATDPPYWGQNDQVSIWLSKENA